MTRAEAKRYGAALEAAGVIDGAGVAGKLPRGLRSTHGASSITGHWAETPQRRAPRRAGLIVCVDVAEALLRGGWSLDAIRACGHTADAARARQDQQRAA